MTRIFLIALMLLAPAAALADYAKLATVTVSGGAPFDYIDPDGFAGCERVDIDAMDVVSFNSGRLHLRVRSSDGLISSGVYWYSSLGTLEATSGTAKPAFDTNGDRVDRDFNLIQLSDSPRKLNWPSTSAIKIYNPTSPAYKRVAWHSIGEDDLERPTTDNGMATIRTSAAITGVYISGSGGLVSGRFNVYCVN